MRAGIQIPWKPVLVAPRATTYRRLAVVWPVMAFLTQERRTRLQQRRDVGTMWRMAVRTVFSYWLVLPQERSTLFGMAQEAGFIDRILLQQFGAR